MFRGSDASDKFIERATNKSTQDIDVAAMVELNDLIITERCTPSDVISTLAKKLRNDIGNPNVVHKSLQVLDYLVKNSGSRLYKELASEKLISAVALNAKTSDYSYIRTKALELIQTWAHAFGKLPEYNKIKETYILLKSEGIHFPPIQKDATDLFDPATEIYPEMREVKSCYRCRAGFGFLVKKHRCEKCGNIFCAKCTSHKIKIPGKSKRDKTVKVCVMCGEKLAREHESNDDTFDTELKMAMLASVEEHRKRIALMQEQNYRQHQMEEKRKNQADGKLNEKSAKQLELEREEKEQLELAIALSKSEAEEKERQQVEEAKKKVNSSLPTTSKDSTTTGNNSMFVKNDIDDPILARYMDRSYWETRRTYYQPGSPGATTTEFPPSAPVEMQPENDDTDKFADSLREQMDLFVNRMKSNSSRGRHISNDSTVQNLFNTLIPMHNELMSRAKNLDHSRGHYENLQDKMSQIKEARSALDELRNEHQMQKQWVAAEQKYMSQIQMQNKLMELRQKKQIYLRTQEEMAIRQIQEEELQLKINAEQQRMISSPFITVVQPQNMISQSLAPQVMAPAMFVAPSLASPYVQQPQSYLYTPNNAAVTNLPQDHGQLNMTSTQIPTPEPRAVMNAIKTAQYETTPQTSVSVPHVPQSHHDDPLPGSNSEPVVRSNEVSPGTSGIFNSDSVQTGTVNVRKEPSTEQLITFD